MSELVEGTEYLRACRFERDRSGESRAEEKKCQERIDDCT